MDQAKIGSFLRELRKEKNLTQEQLAERFGVAARTVSRWENGNNMPDLSVLVALADFYDVDLRELIDGERKSENMTEEMKDTFEKVAEYSDKTNKKKITKVVALMLIPIVALTVLLVIVFSGRHMENIPDAYPAYRQVHIDANITEKLIKEYVVDHMSEASGESHNFASVKVFSSEEKEENDYYVYTWVFSSAYFCRAGVLTEESGSSYPCRFELMKDNDGFRIAGAAVPRDGDYYSEDIKKLFPGYVVDLIDTVHTDGTVNVLTEETLADAKAYFNVD